MTTNLIPDWEQLQNALDGGGTVKLTNPIQRLTPNSTLTVAGTVTLDLAGQKISEANKAFTTQIIKVESGAKLTLVDSKGGGSIAGASTNGILVCGELHMSGGEISGSDDSGVKVDGGTFYMSGGEISGNHYGVRVNSGAFYMSGGKINNNLVGTIVYNSGTLELSGGEISGNTTGGISTSGTFKLSGDPTFSANTHGDVILGASSNKSIITLAGPILAETPISVRYEYSETTGVFTSGYGTYCKGLDPTKCFKSVRYDKVAALSGSEFALVAKDDACTVTFKDDEGTILQSCAVAKGTVPAYLGKEPTKAADEEHGYAFSGWTPQVVAATGDATYKAVFEAKDKYICSEGSGSTWTKGSPDPLTLTFKRWDDNGSTLKYFKGVEVDGKAVPEKDSSGKPNWTAAEGSVILSLQPSFLETLAAGDHTVKALFDDGSSQATFTVKAAPAASSNSTDSASGKSGLPDTSDKLPIAPFAATTLLSLAAVLVSRTKLQPTHAARHGKHAR